jgi:hypothetical protein
MEALFEMTGRVAGWLNRDGVIVDTGGRARAFVQRGGVYTLNGEYLGELQDGFVCDQAGGAVVFVRNGFGGPDKPSVQLPGMPPVVQPLRVRLFPRPPSVRTRLLRKWSALSFAGFLEGKAPIGSALAAPPESRPDIGAGGEGGEAPAPRHQPRSVAAGILRLLAEAEQAPVWEIAGENYRSAPPLFS